MAFNKRAHLLNNITAIETAFEVERSGMPATEAQRELLYKFSGFGGLKCILKPCEKDEDKSGWNESEKDLFLPARYLYHIIREASQNEEEYKRYADSMRSSILSAFYTPMEIVGAVSVSLEQAGIRGSRFLDPSSGTGKFADTFARKGYTTVSFEPDLLTGKILKALHPDKKILNSGFETLPPEFENYFDIISSNIPFGDYAVFDPAFTQENKARYNASKSIHNYFFVKSIDAARQGGIIALITSQGVMDSPRNEDVRRLLMENCNLVSAIRLPNNLFADSSGIRIGSDLIVLQKDSAKQELNAREQAFIGTRSFPGGIHVNNYYMDFSHIVHTEPKVGKNPYNGQPAMEFYHSGDMATIADDLSKKLTTDCNLFLNQDLYNKNQKHDISEAPALENSNSAEEKPFISLYDLFDIPENERTQISEKQRKQVVKNTRDESRPLTFEELEDPMSTVIMTKDPRPYQGNIEPFYKKNTLVTDRGQIGYISYKEDPQKDGKITLFNPVDVPASQIARIRDYIPLRDAYLRIYAFELSYEKENEGLRKDLNEEYENFVKKHGDLNEKDNIRFILLDTHGRETLALESFQNGQKQLADIFTRPVNFMSDKGLLTDKPDEALASSLNKYGQVDLGYMASISTMSEKELTENLEGKIFYNPLIGNYEFSTTFVSGDVREKADQIEIYVKANPGDEQLERCLKSLKVLQDAIPEQIPFTELDFNFGERWIPPHYFAEYASELLGTKIDIDYLSDLDNFFIEADDENTIEIKENHAIVTADKRKYDGLALIKYALINTCPDITKTEIIDGQEVKLPDTEAIQLANSKIDEIRNGFMDWLSGQSPGIKNELQDLYNKKFNSRVKPQYDGKFQTFPGLQLKPLGIPGLYNSQYDASWMLKCNEGGIVDHEVGTGKTLTICITAYEMKRLKMANKPMIIGLKSNVHEIADAFSKGYPNAKILFPTESDFEPENRKRLFNNIKNNNWDAIILTHDQFIKIPQSHEIQRSILQQELDSVTENLRVYEQQSGRNASSGQIKGLEKRKKNLTAKLKDVQHRIDKRKDGDIVDFREMGIDHLFVDESHIFKNLQFTTRYDRVAGLGTPEGSQRALNLLFAIRTIQMKKDKDLCATFLSGTTVSNSLVELYLLFKYLRPRALEAQGIRTFDAWAAVFAKKTTDFEFSVTGEIKQKERFRYFKNVSELGNFYNEITDFRTADEVKVDRPENIITLKTIPATPEMEAFLPKLIDFSNTKDASCIDRPPLSYQEKKAIGLIVTDYARKMALDMRMIDPEKYHDHFDNKASHCAAQVADFYKKYDLQKGTQFVFSDLGTYNPEKWNVFSEIKRKLVQDYNIPAKEIRFINEGKSRDMRKNIISEMKEGTVRVVMGSTTMLGTGVNAQDRAVAGHNLDVPWKPSELTQRVGRYARAGNKVAKEHAGNEVHTILYAAHNSLDTYKFNLLQNKDLFIKQLKTNSLGVRTIDEGALSEDGGMNFSEYVAILSGNTDLLDKVKIERQVSVLQGEFKAYNNNLSGTKWRLEEALVELGKKENRLEGMVKDLEQLERMAPRNEEGIRPNPIKINGLNETDPEMIGNKLREINMTAETRGEYKKIGTLLDFNILVKTDRTFDIRYNHFFVEGACKYAYNNGNLANDPLLAATNFIKALDKIPDLIESYKTDVDRLRKDIPALEKVVSTPWRKEKELSDLKSKLDTLERKIKDSMSKQNQTGDTSGENKHKPIDETVIKISPVMPAGNTIKTGMKI
ncbi:N-6 DNA methylase [Dysgonomonas sp. UBA7698]|uniref:N-6 DNA methylase n=1 Tax=Dysgonomonas sp. UBA7698 TaxID=1946427 RepID=UPI0025C0B265|nr:N-6 DNA methylase [Dysgonomonas sp. UBA7698]